MARPTIKRGPSPKFWVFTTSALTSSDAELVLSELPMSYTAHHPDGEYRRMVCVMPQEGKELFVQIVCEHVFTRVTDMKKVEGYLESLGPNKRKNKRRPAG